MRPVPFQRMREGAVMASALGLKEAARRLGISPSRLCEWRKIVERQTGEKMPRKYHWRARRAKLLSASQEWELRALRKKGASWASLSKRFGVSVGTCRRACDEPGMRARSLAGRAAA